MEPAVLFHNLIVIVPVGEVILPIIWIETPIIVIAPGVNAADVFVVVVVIGPFVLALVSRREVGSTRPHVEADEKFPDPIECNVAIF
jgi:hypothetical protein